MKFLLWVVIGFLVVTWLYRGKRKVQKTPPAPPGASAEAMRACAHCGVHIPASEAIVAQSGLVFCSEAHRLQHFSA